MTAEKENTRPSTGILERANWENSLGGGISHSQFSISALGGQEGISALLSPGAQNGLFLSDLVRITGLSDREVRMKIALERRHGIPILSDCVHGYFLPATDAERAACVRSLRHRANEILTAARAIEEGREPL